MTARPFRHIAAHLLAAASLAAAPSIAAAQTTGSVAPLAPAADYADIAELVVSSPLIVDATLVSGARIKPSEAVGLAPGLRRFYVEADVIALVRGTAAIPQRVGWLVDVRPDSLGRFPRLKKQRVLAFARPVSGRPALLQLVAPDAQRMWNPALDALVRRIAREAIAPDAPPAITGVRSAFFAAGALPGEGETQIFLTTAADQPAALSIERRDGAEPRWNATFGEVIADAPPPARETLTWYRLACGLPRDLPVSATSALSPEDAARATEDYRFVLEQLGPCRSDAAPSISGGAGPM